MGISEAIVAGAREAYGDIYFRNPYKFYSIYEITHLYFTNQLGMTKSVNRRLCS